MDTHIFPSFVGFDLAVRSVIAVLLHSPLSKVTFATICAEVSLVDSDVLSFTVFDHHGVVHLENQTDSDNTTFQSVLQTE